MNNMVARRWPQMLAWLALLLLLVAGLPIFLCMPLWGDVTLYDLAARNILRGGIHYRDIFDTNLPGMVWLHCAIRSVFGWHSETLRAVDFLVFASIAWLLVRWLRPQGLIGAGSVWMATALIAYYFSTTEWSHCQRDTWMLLPALAALYVRRRQLSDLVNPESSFKQVGLALLVRACCGCRVLDQAVRRRAGAGLLASDGGLAVGDENARGQVAVGC